MQPENITEIRKWNNAEDMKRKKNTLFYARIHPHTFITGAEIKSKCQQKKKNKTK